MSAERSTETPAHKRAMDEARKTPLLFIPRHIGNVEIQRQVHGTTAVGGFNAAVAVLVTKVVGTMYCAYVFTLIALVALPAALAQGSPRARQLAFVKLPSARAAADHPRRAERDLESPGRPRRGRP